MSLHYEISPCHSCNRVFDPDNCDNKNCLLWRRWFLRQWARLHDYPRRQKEQPAQPVGVVIGGVRYACPVQVQDYLAQDPCHDCLCTPDQCRTPCRARQNWAKVRSEVRE